MGNYLMIIFATILLALNFAVTKEYQQKEGTSLENGLKFNILLGAFSAGIFFVMNGFKIELNVFSVVMASIMAIVIVVYTIIGFKIMSEEKMALYTVFLMSGGMIVPYIWGLLFLNEPFSILRTIGLIVIAAAVFITNADSSKPGAKQIIMCLAVFLLNGCVSVISKEHQINPQAASFVDFLIINSLAKVLFCFITLLFVKNRNAAKSKISLKPVLIIFSSALLSGFSYLLQLIGAKNLEATVLYPIVTGGGIIFTAFAGSIFFKEKITFKIALGIILCFAGTCMFL